MKIAISLFAFLFTLTLTHATLAAEEAVHKDSKAEKAEQEEAKKVEEMRALFPPKTADVNLAQEPAKTTLEEPTAFAKVSGNEVTLKWKAVSGADQYHLQVATDPNFKWLVTNEYFLKDTSYKQGHLEAGKHYFWRVNAVKENNEPTHRKSGFVMSMFETTGSATK
jgi:hypothetical protein